jgi:hypothetical protein
MDRNVCVICSQNLGAVEAGVERGGQGGSTWSPGLLSDSCHPVVYFKFIEVKFEVVFLRLISDL